MESHKNQINENRTSRLAELDLLRFVAAVSVVLFHFCAAPIVQGTVDTTAFGAVGTIARFGYLGVELFFLISGFVIIMSVQHRSVRGFLVHRALRLYPSFWAAILLTVIAISILGAATDVPSVRVITANMTMLPGYLGVDKLDEVYWTLAVELKFYAIVAIILSVGLIKRAEALAICWIGLLAIVEVGVGGAWLRSLLIYPHGSLFAAGILFYFVNRDGWTLRRVLSGLDPI